MFRVGQKIICVNNENSRVLNAGQIYRVVAIAHPYIQIKDMLGRLVNTGTNIRADRFAALEGEEPQAQERSYSLYVVLGRGVVGPAVQRWVYGLEARAQAEETIAELKRQNRFLVSKKITIKF